jgi:PST family polysaccharide transporter
VSSGQAAVIQGLRRINEFAMLAVASPLLATMVTIPVLFLLGADGIVLSLIAAAATTLLASWWYSRHVGVERTSIPSPAFTQEAFALLKLGLAFTASGLMMMGTFYVVRIIVLRMVTFEAVGLYQAAWAVGGLYVGFILQAMGTDFYPRLTAAAHRNSECNRLVNEQAQVSLLLAGPGVVATLTFAPLVVSTLYTPEFDAAASLLRWICAGMALRIVTWPIGYIILAKGDQKLFFITELAWTLVHAGLAWVCIRSLGLDGAGMAFFGSYVFHALLIYPVVRSLSGFRWSTATRTTGMLFVTSIAVVFSAFYVLSNPFATAVGVVVLLFISVYSVRTLATLVPLADMPAPVRRLALLFGIARGRV